MSTSAGQERDPDQHPYLLVEYEWFAEITGDLRDELRSFARDAMAYDLEAGFTTISDLEGPPGSPLGPPRRLVVRKAVDPERGEQGPGALAAYFSVTDVDELGVGRAVLVVAPELRSRGIATLLVERLSRESPTADWFGTGLTALRVLADGAHPAAGRLAARFGFPVVGETWLLLRMLRGPVARPDRSVAPAIEVAETVMGAEIRAGVPVRSAEVDPAHGRSLVQRTYVLGGGSSDAYAVTRHSIDARGEPDRMARMGYSAGVSALSDSDVEALIAAATDDLYAAGARSVLAEVDPSAEVVVRASRRAYFQHDQSNLVFGVPVPQAR